jgi:GGDEF domain-containing protein
MIHPIYLFIFSILMLIMIILQSLQQEKVFVLRLIFVFVFVFGNATLTYLTFNETIVLEALSTLNQQLYLAYTILVFFILLLLILSLFKSSTLKSNHYALFIKAMKNSKFNMYFILDQKDKLKDISIGFLNELGLEKEDSLGKKLNQTLSKTIRLQQLNNEDATPKDLQNFLSMYKKTVKPSQTDVLEMIFLNALGERTLIRFILQPVFVFSKFRGLVAVGEKKTNIEMIAVEKELEQSNFELESIRHKFVAVLELTKEGLFSIDLEKQEIWMNDAANHLFQLGSETTPYETFLHRLVKEDQEKRDQIINRLSFEAPTYEFKYRILKENQTIWVVEKGKYLFDNQEEKIIMGTIQAVQTKHFPASNIDVLDALKTYHEIEIDLQKKNNNQQFYDILYISMHNLNELNLKHGRDVGNMFLSEYIKQMRKTFISESGDIYRMSGSRFIILITDPRRVENLEKGLQTGTHFMDVSLQYGTIREQLQVNAVMMENSCVKNIHETLKHMEQQLITLRVGMQKKSTMRLYDEI